MLASGCSGGKSNFFVYTPKHRQIMAEKRERKWKKEHGQDTQDRHRHLKALIVTWDGLRHRQRQPCQARFGQVDLKRREFFSRQTQVSGGGSGHDSWQVAKRVRQAALT
jgi:hypothetical protein